MQGSGLRGSEFRCVGLRNVGFRGGSLEFRFRGVG